MKLLRSLVWALAQPDEDLRKKIGEIAIDLLKKGEGDAVDICVDITPPEQMKTEKNRSLKTSNEFQAIISEMRADCKKDNFRSKPLIGMGEKGAYLFKSIKDAQKLIGVLGIGDISNCCKGTQKSVKGMTFKYIFHDKNGEWIE